MAEVASAFVTIIPSYKGGTAGISRLLGPDADAAGDDAGRRAGSRFSKAFKFGAAGVAAGLGAIFKTGFDEQKDFLAGSAQLAAGIKSTGNAANVSVGGLEDLASTIQNYSGQTDDSIVASEKLLLTFTGIKNVAGKNNDIFNQATKVTADMAAKMGTDASSSAIVLGKALNDPVQGISALSRVGVSFTAGQKNTIKSMVSAGNVMGAQKVILGELNKEFGGAAKAAGDSLPGQMARAQRSFEDVSQSVAASLMPVLRGGADLVTKHVVPAFASVVGFFTSGSTGAKVLGGALAALVVILGVHKAATLASSAAQKVAAVTSGALRAAQAVATGVQAAYAAATGAATVATEGNTAATVGNTVGTVAARVAQLAVAAATRVWAATQWLLNAAMTANPIGLVIAAIVGLVAIIVIAWKRSETFRNILSAAFRIVTLNVRLMWTYAKIVFAALMATFRAVGSVAKAIFNGIGAAFRAVGATVRTVGNAISATWRATWNGIKAVVTSVWGGIKSVVSGAINTVLGTIRTVTNSIKSVWSTVWNGLKNTVKNVVGSIKDIVSGIWDGVTSGLKSALNGAIRILNGAINFINDKLIDTANEVPFVNIPHIPKIPELAKGGVINPSPGGTVVRVAEAGQPEAVIPLDRFDDFRGKGGNDGPVVAGDLVIQEVSDPETTARKVARALRKKAA